MKPLFIVLLLVCAALVAGAFLITSGGDDGSGGQLVEALGAGGDLVRLDAPEAELASAGARAEEREDVTPRAVEGAARAQRPAHEARPEPRTEPFRGRVLNNLGLAIEGAEVLIGNWRQGELERSIALDQRRAAGKHDAVTGPDGTFTFDGGHKLGKTVVISVSARGHLVETRRHDFDRSDDADFGDLFLDPAVIVEGWVRDDSGLPVKGARVRRIDDNEGDGAEAIVEMLEGFGMTGLGGRVETDADGHFELPHERPGSIVLVAEEEAHLPGRFEGITPPAPGVLPPVVLTLTRGGSIEGRVLGYPSGRRGARIAAQPLDAEGLEDGSEESRSGLAEILDATLTSAGSYACEIDDDGHFLLRGLPIQGRFELQVAEKKDFVRVVPLSAAVEAAVGDAGVVLYYDAGATLTIQVVDAETKAPIPLASVTAKWEKESARNWLTPNGRKRPKRAEGGRLTLHELRPSMHPAELELHVSAPGYLARTVSGITVATRAQVDGGVVELRPATPLTFRVLDAETGDPVRRAHITLREEREVAEGELGEEAKEELGIPTARTARSTGRTGRDGRCTLDALEVQTAELTVRSAKYASHRESGFPLARAAEEYVVRLSRGGELEVFVRDPNGTPIEGALVRARGAGDSAEMLGSQRHSTNAGGVARFESLTTGTYEVRADHAVDALAVQLQILSENDGDLEWTTVTVEPRGTTELQLELPGLGTVEGLVTSNGIPLANAQVTLRDETEDDELSVMLDVQDELGNAAGRPKDETGGDGHFRLVGVPEGDYILRVRHAELAMPEEIEVKVAVGVNEVDVRASTTAVTGRVVDDEGEPIVGARVRAIDVDAEVEEEREIMQFLIGDFGSSTTTDATGTFDLRGLRPNSRLRIEASATGFVAARSDELLLSIDEVRADIDLALDRAGSVEVSLVGELEEIPASMVRAHYLGEEGLYHDRYQIVRGRVGMIADLAPGRWEVALTDIGSRNEVRGEPVTITIEVGQRARVELVR